MAQSAERYGVRIRPPEGLTSVAVGDLALMVAPITGQSAHDLEVALSDGPVVVAQHLALAEAEQLVAVFNSLGAAADLIEPGQTGGLKALFKREDAVDPAWRSVRMNGPPDDAPATVPFDAERLRAALVAEGVTRVEAGPQGGQGRRTTQPLHSGASSGQATGPPLDEPPPGDDGALLAATEKLDIAAIREALSQYPTPGRDVGEPTEPLDAGALRRALEDHARQTGRPPAERGVETTPPPQVLPRELGRRLEVPPSIGTLETQDLESTPLESSSSRAARRTAKFEPETGPGLRDVGPLIFKLDAPPQEPTKADDVQGQTGVTDTAPGDSFGAQRPGLYQLDRGIGVDQGARVVSIEPPNSEELEIPAFRRPRPQARPAPVPKRAVPLVVGLPSELPYLPTATPAPQRKSDHNPLMAAALAAALPGMGQVYNGQPERGVWFALGAVLVLPWVLGVVDALRVGRAILRGDRPPPEPVSRRAAARSHLVLDLALVFGVAVGVLAWERLNNRGTTQAAARGAVDMGVDAAPAPVPDAGPFEPLGVQKGAEQQRLEVADLMRRGQMACDHGRYAECEELMRAVVRLDPGAREARSLLVEANSKRRRGRKGK